MEAITSKSGAVFARRFNVPGFAETLPAGEYEIETELVTPPDLQHPAAWKASVLVKLHPRTSHPGLARTLTVSLAALDYARAKDKLTGRELSSFFLEEMLADPMVRLVMKADGISEAHLRHIYSDGGIPDPDLTASASANNTQRAGDDTSMLAPENEGMHLESKTLSRSRNRRVVGKI
jgi:hypothetical protein